MGSYKKEDLETLHRIEIRILQQISQVCEQQGLIYYIDWGTLLGAVRHGGFIPWDDDIDITMPRTDYEKFIALAPECLPSDLFLQHYSTEPAAPTYMAKVRLNGTKFVEEYAVNIPIHQGIFVDIFPLDKTAPTASEQKRHKKQIQWWRNLYVSKCIAQTSYTQNKVRKAVLGSVRAVLHFVLLPVPKEFIYQQLDNTLKKYNTSDSPFYTCYGEGVHLHECLFPTAPCSFAGIPVQAPADAKSVLTEEYGDFMQLPPEEKRVNHRPAILDFGKEAR